MVMRLENYRPEMVLVLQESKIPSIEDNRLNQGSLGSDLSSHLVSTFVNNSTSDNNNEIFEAPLRERLYSESNSLSSRDESIGDYEGQSSSSVDIFPQGDEYQCFSQEDLTDSDFSDDGNFCKDEPTDFNCRGITNPNYTEYSDNLNPAEDDNGNDTTDRINHLDSSEHYQKDFYDKPKFETKCPELVHDLNIVSEPNGRLNELNIVSDASVTGSDNVFPEINFVITSENHKFEFSPKETYQDCLEIEKFESSFLVETTILPVCGVYETTILSEDDSESSPSPSEELKQFALKETFIGELREDCSDNVENHKMELISEHDRELSLAEVSCKSVKDFANEQRISELAAEKINRVCSNEQNPLSSSGIDTELCIQEPVIDGRHKRDGPRMDQKTGASSKYRSCARPSRPPSDKSKIGIFDVYNIETAMPHIDLDAIELHLRAAREEERKRRNDREEIRRRLAMGTDNDEYFASGKKPSLQSRLQGGMNLQICFMNDTGSDSESPGTDIDAPDSLPSTKKDVSRPPSLSRNFQGETVQGIRPSPAKLTLPLKKDLVLHTEADLFACQARLQAEARQALMQAKEMARMQMEVEKQKMPLSPITQMVRSSLLKVGVPFPENRRRLSRQILTEMNVAQLQVIINDLHTQIEVLNESLVEMLMSRDDLHMEQDSMLVDIEDLTRYIGAKEKMHDERTQVSGNNNKNHNLKTTVEV